MDIIDEPASMNPPPLINVWLCIAIIIPVMFILTIMLICITITHYVMITSQSYIMSQLCNSRLWNDKLVATWSKHTNGCFLEHKLVTRIRGMAEGTAKPGLGLTPLSPFDPLSDPTSLGQRWKNWLRSNGMEKLNSYDLPNVYLHMDLTPNFMY